MGKTRRKWYLRGSVPCSGFYRVLGILACTILLFLAAPSDQAFAQKRGDNTKAKKVPKVKKVRTKTTKKSGNPKIQVIKPRTASGRSRGNYKTVKPSFTPRSSAPAFKKVVPKSASGRNNFKDRGSKRPASASSGYGYKGGKTRASSTSTGYNYKGGKVRAPSASRGYGYKGGKVRTPSASSGYGYRGGKVRTPSASSGFGYKNKVVRPRSASTGFNFKNKIIRPRSASSGYGYGNKTVRPRSGSTGFNDSGRRVRPKSASSGYRFRGRDTRPPSASRGYNYKKGSRSPRSVSGNFGYAGGKKMPQSATGRNPFKVGSVNPRYSRHGSGPDATKVQIRSIKRRSRYNVVKVRPRTTPSRFKFKPGETVKGRGPEKNTTASLFTGGIRFKGRPPRLVENQKGRDPNRSQRKKRIVKVVPRSINSNPTYKPTANQTKLIHYPKDVSTIYVGNLKGKSRRHRDVGTHYSGNLKRPVRNNQPLDKSDYIKSRNKSQWASYYRSKTKKQSDFKGFQKVKYKSDKWMHPSVSHRLSRFVGTYKAKETVRKLKLWVSRKQKNDDQPRYLKGKPKKDKYDKDEIKIWSDYENTRGTPEGVKTSKRQKNKENSDDQ